MNNPINQDNNNFKKNKRKYRLKIKPKSFDDGYTLGELISASFYIDSVNIPNMPKQKIRKRGEQLGKIILAKEKGITVEDLNKAIVRKGMRFKPKQDVLEEAQAFLKRMREQKD